MLVAEDLGYSGKALEMKVGASLSSPFPREECETDVKQVPNYHAPGELSGIASARL